MKITIRVLLLVGAGMIYIQTFTVALAQQVTCNLRALDTGVMLGRCESENWSQPVVLQRPDGQSDLVWSGGIYFDDNTARLEIATYGYSEGPRLIAKTHAWYLLEDYGYSSSGLSISWDESKQAPPSEIDLEILIAASEMISSVDMWDREDDRNCENDSGTLSVYCALAKSTAHFMGRYQHRQPAMQAVRFVIQEKWPDRITSHRLMDFNNDPSTTLEDLHQLFEMALGRLRPELQ